MCDFKTTFQYFSKWKSNFSVLGGILSLYPRCGVHSSQVSSMNRIVNWSWEQKLCWPTLQVAPFKWQVKLPDQALFICSVLPSSSNNRENSKREAKVDIPPRKIRSSRSKSRSSIYMFSTSQLISLITGKKGKEKQRWIFPQQELVKWRKA